MIYYFDNAATTAMDSNLIELWKKYSCDEYFNPSALSDHSSDIYKSIENARKSVAKSLGANPDEIFFTSGGTEADNLAIFGAVGSKKGNIITSQVEHPAVFNTIKFFKNRGIEVRYVELDGEGAAKVESLANIIDNNTILVSLMHVNNETGAINDIEKLSKTAKSKNNKLLFMSDGVQAYGKLPIRLNNTAVDMYTISGHKVCAPKGSGALYLKKGTNISTYMFGGGQEKDKRPGTENVPNIICLGKISEEIQCSKYNSNDLFLELKNTILEIVLNSGQNFINLSTNGSSSILYLLFKNVKSEVLMRLLEADGFIVGNGSACSAKHRTNRILEALKIPNEYKEGGIRISFGKHNTLEQAKLLGNALVKKLQIF